MFSIFGKGKKNAEPDAPNVPPGDQGRGVRPMTKADIPAVLAIIEAHDEDDAEEARDTFKRSLTDMFVAYDGEQVVGVTGSFPDPEADRIAWLSWTYVDERARGEGLGRYLMQGLIEILRGYGVRRLFISTGDYREDGEDIYAAAKALYEAMGAKCELVQAKYFGPGEARHIYTLEITDETAGEAEPAGDLVFEELFEAPETDDGAILTWREFLPDDAEIDAASHLSKLIEEARDKGARFVSAAIPSDLASGAEDGLREFGFEYSGSLQNYYKPGVHQRHWIKHL